MGGRYVFDLETNGFLADVHTIHSLVIKDIDTGEVTSCFADYYKTLWHAGAVRASIECGLKMLADADLIIGHNIIKYDLKVIRKLRPEWKTKAQVRDTLVCTRLIWPEEKLRDLDFARLKKGKHPAKLVGRQSLEAWGYRLMDYKGDYSGEWHTWNVSMQEYCEQDVAVTHKLWDLIVSKKYDERAIEIEHRVAEYIDRQETNGFGFDTPAAAALYATLVQKRDAVDRTLKEIFPPFFLGGKVQTPKRSMRRWVESKHGSVTTRRKVEGQWVIQRGYFETTLTGCQFTKVELTDFNPGSRDHVANRLMTLRGWEPADFTDDGKPKLDETILDKLPFPEAKPLAQYLLLQKRAGQLAEGNQGLLKKERNGRIFGEVVTNGAVTGRATHRNPNIAQVPKVGTMYGAEFRALFIPRVGWKLVGADTSGLELRMLAHYMAKWDGGKYAEAVINGQSEDETDVHSLNAKALGFEPKKVYQIGGKTAKGRDIAKTFIYAFLYGAGDEKIGSIVGKGKAEGKRLKARFLQQTPALKYLIDAVQHAARTRGYLVGLDGRILHVRSAHASLNTLLQGAGAICCKQWLLEIEDALLASGLLHYRSGLVHPDDKVGPCAWVHDEVQLETTPEVADEVGRICVEAAVRVGQFFSLRVPLAGEFKVGANWAETH